MRMLGRLPRKYNSRIAHLSAFLAAAKDLPPPPDGLDYSKGMPADLGMMLNDRLGCCTCSAFYHARQVWRFNCGHEMLTDPDQYVLRLYEKACGYRPSDPSTDQGGVEQYVLRYLYKRGAPIPGGVDKILGFLETDPRDILDIKRVVWDFGCAYIGFIVPSNVLPPVGDPPDLWEWDPGAHAVGGHAVICVGYTPDTVKVISWGRTYEMTWEFFVNATDEAYPIIDQAWLDQTGKNPLGLTVDELKLIMASL